MLQEVIDEMVAMGYDAPDAKEGADWDSNVITPGTSFMAKISLFMRFYILDKMNSNPYWRSIKVVFSDASEPGEGEHKIMNFIRNQRAQLGYDPNQYHILHGLDADLIMLALATHEAHFTILREKVFFGKKSKEEPEKSQAQLLLDSQWIQSGAKLSELRPQDEWLFAKPLQTLNVHVLRDYLDNEFRCLAAIKNPLYDLERIIDDFIFLCFFVGNDFLPHLPSLDIRDGALDFLIEVYKEILPSLGEYLTSPGGNLNLEQVDVILGRVGEIEDLVFQKKKEAEDVLEKRKSQQKGYAKSGDVAEAKKQIEALMTANNAKNGREKLAQPIDQQVLLKDQYGSSKRSSENVDTSNKRQRVDSDDIDARKEDKRNILDEDEIDIDDFIEEEEEEEVSLVIKEKPIESLIPKKKLSKEELDKAKEELKRRISEKEQSMYDTYKQTIHDEVKLHEAGWKDRYYGEKHKKENIEENGGLSVMCMKYVQGLCWVLEYYYEGVPSWNWYYPFHYAPFASDLVNIDRYGPIEFEKSEPFRPVEQLLAVLPSNSVRALPEPCRWLMTDPASPIIDLYNNDIPIDPNGKHLPWLWILLLPFVDETRITAAFSMCKPDLSLEDRRRNAFGSSLIFIHKDTSLSEFILSRIRYIPGKETDLEVIEALRQENDDLTSSELVVNTETSRLFFDAVIGGGMSGEVDLPPPLWFAPIGGFIQAPADEEDDRNPFSRAQNCIHNNAILVFSYSLPPAPAVHQSRILDGVVFQPSILNSFDLIQRRPPRLNRAGFSILDMLQAVRNRDRRQGGSGYQQYNSQGFDQQHAIHNQFNQHNQGFNGTNVKYRDSYDRNSQRDNPSAFQSQRYNNDSYDHQPSSYHQNQQNQSYRHPIQAPFNNRSIPYSQPSRNDRFIDDYKYPAGSASRAHQMNIAPSLPSFGQQLARGGQPKALYDMPGRGEVVRRSHQPQSHHESERFSSYPKQQPPYQDIDRHPKQQQQRLQSSYDRQSHHANQQRPFDEIAPPRAGSRFGERVDTQFAPPSTVISLDTRQGRPPNYELNASRPSQWTQPPQSQPFQQTSNSYYNQQQQQSYNPRNNSSNLPGQSRPSYGGMEPSRSYQNAPSEPQQRGEPTRSGYSSNRSTGLNPNAPEFQFNKSSPLAAAPQYGSMQSLREQLLQTVNSVKKKQ